MIYSNDWLEVGFLQLYNEVTFAEFPQAGYRIRPPGLSANRLSVMPLTGVRLFEISGFDKSRQNHCSSRIKWYDHIVNNMFSLIVGRVCLNEPPGVGVQDACPDIAIEPNSSGLFFCFFFKKKN